MARLTMESSKAPASPGTSTAPMFEAMERRLVQEVPGLGSIREVRDEIDTIQRSIKEFHENEPDEVMQHCSAYAARLGEIRTRIFRIEDHLQHWKPIRTQEVVPVIEDLKFQFSIASRLLTQRQHDWDMERGNT